jgi:hypothetical protein
MFSAESQLNSLLSTDGGCRTKYLRPAVPADRVVVTTHCEEEMVAGCSPEPYERYTMDGFIPRSYRDNELHHKSTRTI